MPLPLKTLRILPNPWTNIHYAGASPGPDKGPQGAYPMDSAGRSDMPLRFIGAILTEDAGEKRKDNDPRGPNNKGTFKFPALNPTLTSGTPIDVPASSAYYRDALRDGDVVPGDAATAERIPCRFKSLAEARAAGIAKFEAEHGEGTFAEAFPALAGKAPKKSSEPGEQSATDGGQK
jgi:hypothetical protein